MGAVECPSEDQMEGCFLAVLPVIEAAIRTAGRRCSLSEDEISEFASEVKLAMVRSRYRALARYEGRSSLPTYLNTVIRRMLIDFRRTRLGKWRSSASARRLGAHAVELERLIFRDGLSSSEAASVCASRHGLPKVDDYMELIHALPARHPRRTQSLEWTPAEPVDHSPLPDQARCLDETARRLEAAMGRALAALNARDREVVRLRFEQGLGAREIGRLLDIKPKVVYRRTDWVLMRLRDALQSEGLAWGDAARTMGRSSWTLSWPDSSHTRACPEIAACNRLSSPESRSTGWTSLEDSSCATEHLH